MNRRLWIIIIAALFSSLAPAQSAPISGQVINQYGQPAAGVQVYICAAATSTGLPCSPVSTIYSDYNLQNQTPNPTTTDENGNFSVYVGALAFPNAYVANAVPQSGTTYTWLYPGPSCPLSGCTFTGIVTAPIFNATSSPYYEINGVQISSAALSDAANLAKLNASNTFTGTTQTAPVWNATNGFDINGAPLASSNLSDSANLARVNAANTFTAGTNTFQAITATTVNVSGGYRVNGVALAASNLSNGVSGTGAICLASGSACSSGGSVTNVAVASSNSQLTVSGSPITGSGTINLALNLTGVESKLVTAASAGTVTHCAVWDGSGGIGDSGMSCSPGSSSPVSPSGYISLMGGMIIEWTQGATQSTSGFSQTITYPLACPTTVLSVMVGTINENGGSPSDTEMSYFQEVSGTRTNSQVSVFMMRNADHAFNPAAPTVWIVCI